jgi:hypothetical protein
MKGAGASRPPFERSEDAGREGSKMVKEMVTEMARETGANMVAKVEV